MVEAIYAMGFCGCAAIVCEDRKITTFDIVLRARRRGVNVERH
jgi:hypothetical protein